MTSHSPLYEIAQKIWEAGQQFHDDTIKAGVLGEEPPAAYPIITPLVQELEKYVDNVVLDRQKDTKRLDWLDSKKRVWLMPSAGEDRPLAAPITVTFPIGHACWSDDEQLDTTVRTAIDAAMAPTPIPTDHLDEQLIAGGITETRSTPLPFDGEDGG